MNINDILEIEQRKYCYEQAYALHRHLEIPELFVKKENTVFAIPAANDHVTGWETINTKFREDLYFVAPEVDSFHTGWQICVPVIWEEQDGEMCGIFPTFGYLVLNMDPSIMKPPYLVLSTQELWYDHFLKDNAAWKISDLRAQFLFGQCVWKWDISKDFGYAVQKKLRTIPHPFLTKTSLRETDMDETGRTASEISKTGISEMGIFKSGCDIQFRGDAYYGIQFAMSLYVLLWQCTRMDEIPHQVFVSDTDISVCYQEKPYRGSKAVQDFFSGIKDQTIEIGGFLRMDMPATQSIVFCEDGNTAVGNWLTMTSEIHTSTEGNRFGVSIGKFTIQFTCEQGIWKMKQLCWEVLQKFVPFQETPDQHLEAYRKDPKAWLSPLPQLQQLSGQETDLSTAETLALRNQLLSRLFLFHENHDLSGSISCNTQTALQQIKEFQKNAAYILATSPVIRMGETLRNAEAFFSVTLLKEDLNSENMTHTRGGLYLCLEKEADGWSVCRFEWCPYATLEPWQRLKEESFYLK